MGCLLWGVLFPFSIGLDAISPSLERVRVFASLGYADLVNEMVLLFIFFFQAKVRKIRTEILGNI